MTAPARPESAQQTGRRRPAAIWLVVVLGLLQGLVLVVVGVVLVSARGDAPVVDALGREAELVALGLGLAVALLGVAELAATFFLARGGHGARALFGGVAVLQIAAGVYSTVALRDFHVSGLAQVAVSVGILWLLYGAASSERFFAT